MNEKLIQTHIADLAQEKLGLSLHGLALKMGKDFSTLWRIEPPVGSTQEPAQGITFALLRQLCDTLGVTPGELLTIPAPLSTEDTWEAVGQPKTAKRNKVHPVKVKIKNQPRLKRALDNRTQKAHAESN